MQKIDTYLIKWYGPFSSRKELSDWEKDRIEVFNLYAFQAKRKGIKDKYYCGMAFRQAVGKRLSNHDHHIHDFEDEKTKLQIWIGAIANIKAKELDVRVCENIITSELARLGVGEKHLENLTNKIPPANNVYIIHEWWKTDGDKIKRRLRNSVPSVIPEVMEYYSEIRALYGAQRLKYIGDL
jgi:hypothetical protein